MTKNKKAILITISLVLLFIIILNLSFAIITPNKYLSNKYGVNNDFKFLSYKPSHYYSYDGGFLLSAYDLATSKWEYECNGIKFQIQKVDNQLFDDYQLEEISDLCTQYLKYNVDDNISGVIINTQMIFDTNNLLSENRVWNESNIDDFLRLQQDITIYYDNIEYALDEETIKSKLIENKIYTGQIAIEKYDGEQKRSEYGYDEAKHYMIHYYE